MSTQHTPGPWEPSRMTHDWSVYAENGNGADLCASIKTAEDAALIAAAPDLLAACEGILPLLQSDLDALNNWEPEILAVEEAIAKAKGGGR